MIKTRYKILSATMLAAACVGCQRSNGAYHIIASNIHYEHDWRFFAGSGMYGLDQYSYCANPNGLTILDPEHMHQPVGTWQTYTTVCLGNHFFSVRAPAWSIIAFGITGLGLGLWATATAVNAFTGRRLVPDKDSSAKAG